MATFFNQATLSYAGGVTSSNIVTGELVEVLSATKTAVGTTYSPDGTVTYIVSIVNSGTVAYTGLTLSDDLGAYTVGTAEAVPLEYVDGSILYYVNGVLQPTLAITSGEPLVVGGISVPADSNALIVYQARVTNAAPLGVGATITNTVTVSGDGLTTPITAQETVSVEQEPNLTISKSLSPDTVVENGELTYTFVIRNTGNTAAAATDNIVVSDTFDPILNPITVQLDGTTLTEGVDYTYNTLTGEFATVAGRITVPAAAYTQDPTTGIITTVPGTAILRVIGTV